MSNVKREIKIITGNQAAAYACMHAHVGVIAAYPLPAESSC